MALEHDENALALVGECRLDWLPSRFFVVGVMALLYYLAFRNRKARVIEVVRSLIEVHALSQFRVG